MLNEATSQISSRTGTTGTSLISRNGSNDNSANPPGLDYLFSLHYDHSFWVSTLYTIVELIQIYAFVMNSHLPSHVLMSTIVSYSQLPFWDGTLYGGFITYSVYQGFYYAYVVIVLFIWLISLLSIFYDTTALRWFVRVFFRHLVHLTVSILAIPIMLTLLVGVVCQEGTSQSYNVRQYPSKSLPSTTQYVLFFPSASCASDVIAFQRVVTVVVGVLWFIASYIFYFTLYPADTDSTSVRRHLNYHLEQFLFVYRNFLVYVFVFTQAYNAPVLYTILVAAVSFSGCAFFCFFLPFYIVAMNQIYAAALAFTGWTAIVALISLQTSSDIFLNQNYYGITIVLGGVVVMAVAYACSTARLNPNTAYLLRHCNTENFVGLAHNRFATAALQTDEELMPFPDRLPHTDHILSPYYTTSLAILRDQLLNEEAEEKTNGFARGEEDCDMDGRAATAAAVVRRRSAKNGTSYRASYTRRSEFSSYMLSSGAVAQTRRSGVGKNREEDEEMNGGAHAVGCHGKMRSARDKLVEQSTRRQVVSPTLNAIHIATDVCVSTRYMHDWKERTHSLPTPYMVYFATRIYNRSMLKFPSSTLLRISYAQFLCDYAPSYAHMMLCLDILHRCMQECHVNLTEAFFCHLYTNHIKDLLGMRNATYTIMNRRVCHAHEGVLVSATCVWRCLVDRYHARRVEEEEEPSSGHKHHTTHEENTTSETGGHGHRTNAASQSPPQEQQRQSIDRVKSDHAAGKGNDNCHNIIPSRYHHHHHRRKDSDPSKANRNADYTNDSRKSKEGRAARSRTGGGRGVAGQQRRSDEEDLSVLYWHCSALAQRRHACFLLYKDAVSMMTDDSRILRNLASFMTDVYNFVQPAKLCRRAADVMTRMQTARLHLTFNEASMTVDLAGNGNWVGSDAGLAGGNENAVMPGGNARARYASHSTPAGQEQLAARSLGQLFSGAYTSNSNEKSNSNDNSNRNSTSRAENGATGSGMMMDTSCGEGSLNASVVEAEDSLQLSNSSALDDRSNSINSSLSSSTAIDSFMSATTPNANSSVIGSSQSRLKQTKKVSRRIARSILKSVEVSYDVVRSRIKGSALFKVNILCSLVMCALVVANCIVVLHIFDQCYGLTVMLYDLGATQTLCNLLLAQVQRTAALLPGDSQVGLTNEAAKALQGNMSYIIALKTALESAHRNTLFRDNHLTDASMRSILSRLNSYTSYFTSEFYAVKLPTSYITHIEMTLSTVSMIVTQMAEMPNITVFQQSPPMRLLHEVWLYELNSTFADVTARANAMIRYSFNVNIVTIVGCWMVCMAMMCVSMYVIFWNYRRHARAVNRELGLFNIIPGDSVRKLEMEAQGRLELFRYVNNMDGACIPPANDALEADGGKYTNVNHRHHNNNNNNSDRDTNRVPMQNTSRTEDQTQTSRAGAERASAAGQAMSLQQQQQFSTNGATTAPASNANETDMLTANPYNDNYNAVDGNDNDDNNSGQQAHAAASFEPSTIVTHAADPDSNTDKEEEEEGNNPSSEEREESDGRALHLLNVFHSRASNKRHRRRCGRRKRKGVNTSGSRSSRADPDTQGNDCNRHSSEEESDDANSGDGTDSSGSAQDESAFHRNGHQHSRGVASSHAEADEVDGASSKSGRAGHRKRCTNSVVGPTGLTSPDGGGVDAAQSGNMGRNMYLVAVSLLFGIVALLPMLVSYMKTELMLLNINENSAQVSCVAQSIDDAFEMVLLSSLFIVSGSYDAYRPAAESIQKATITVSQCVVQSDKSNFTKMVNAVAKNTMIAMRVLVQTAMDSDDAHLFAMDASTEAMVSPAVDHPAAPHPTPHLYRGHAIRPAPASRAGYDAQPTQTEPNRLSELAYALLANFTWDELPVTADMMHILEENLTLVELMNWSPYTNYTHDIALPASNRTNLALQTFLGPMGVALVERLFFESQTLLSRVTANQVDDLAQYMRSGKAFSLAAVLLLAVAAALTVTTLLMGNPQRMVRCILCGLLVLFGGSIAINGLIALSTERFISRSGEAVGVFREMRVNSLSFCRISLLLLAFPFRGDDRYLREILDATLESNLQSFEGGFLHSPDTNITVHSLARYTELVQRRFALMEYTWPAVVATIRAGGNSSLYADDARVAHATWDMTRDSFYQSFRARYPHDAYFSTYASDITTSTTEAMRLLAQRTTGSALVRNLTMEVMNTDKSVVAGIQEQYTRHTEAVFQQRTRYLIATVALTAATCVMSASGLAYLAQLTLQGFAIQRAEVAIYRLVFGTRTRLILGLYGVVMFLLAVSNTVCAMALYMLRDRSAMVIVAQRAQWFLTFVYALSESLRAPHNLCAYLMTRRALLMGLEQANMLYRRTYLSPSMSQWLHRGWGEWNASANDVQQDTIVQMLGISECQNPAATNGNKALPLVQLFSVLDTIQNIVDMDPESAMEAAPICSLIARLESQMGSVLFSLINYMQQTTSEVQASMKPYSTVCLVALSLAGLLLMLLYFCVLRRYENQLRQLSVGMQLQLLGLPIDILNTVPEVQEFYNPESGSTNDQIKRKLQQSEKLLQNILPPSISRRLKNGERVIADFHPSVTAAFANLVGFDQYSSRLDLQQIVIFLNGIVVAFDHIVDMLDLEKVKTVGDIYFFCGGLIKATARDHALRCMECSLYFYEALEVHNSRHGTPNIKLRVGLNTDTAVAGVIGNKKVAYDLWGDCVNTASRMYSTSMPGHIQVTQATYDHVKSYFRFEDRWVQAKGKGALLTHVYADRIKPSSYSDLNWRLST